MAFKRIWELSDYINYYKSMSGEQLKAVSESEIQKDALDFINKIVDGCAVKYHSDIFTGAGNPDVFAVINNTPVLLEVKTETGRLSRVQDYKITLWQRAGATVYVLRPRNFCEIAGRLLSLSATHKDFNGQTKEYNAEEVAKIKTDIARKCLEKG